MLYPRSSREAVVLLAMCVVLALRADGADRVIHPRWAPKVVDLKPDDVTCIMGYRAELLGRLTHQPMPKNEFYAKPGVYGFVDGQDEMVFRVKAPASDAYVVAVLCNARRDVLDGIEIEVVCGEARATGRPQHVKTPDGPGRLTFQRLRLPQKLDLHEGANEVRLRLRSIPDVQRRAAQADLARRTIPARDTSFRVWSIELAPLVPLGRLRSRALRSDTGWMVEGKYGLFTHWSPLCYPLHGDVQTRERYQRAVDAFDVGAYVEMVERTGAAWVVFTTSHGPHYWPGPNRTIDRILPGRTCRRDLIGELADALARRRVRLMLYYHTGCGDEPWAEAAGMLDADPRKYFDNLVALHEEASRRYGRRVASTGVYIDTSPRVLYQLDFPFERLTRAVKSGNPDAVVGYSTDRLPRLTWFADFASQDGADWAGEAMPDAWFGPGQAYEGLQRSRFFFIDDWIPRKPYEGVFPPPRHPAQQYVEFFQRMAAHRIPVTVNLMITQDVKRGQPFVSPKSMAVMQQVRRALRGN